MFERLGESLPPSPDLSPARPPPPLLPTDLDWDPFALEQTTKDGGKKDVCTYICGTMPLLSKASEGDASQESERRRRKEGT